MELKSYWPRYLQDVLEFVQIAEAEQPEFHRATQDVRTAADDFFLVSLSEYGCARWEAILGLPVSRGDTLAARREKIQIKYLGQLPYTLPQLRNILQALCGAGNYAADIAAGTYHLVVKIGLAAKSNYRDVQSLLQQVIPANLTLELSQMYNTHAELGRLTHAQLAAYTHDYMRNEVLKNGG